MMELKSKTSLIFIILSALSILWVPCSTQQQPVYCSNPDPYNYCQQLFGYIQPLPLTNTNDLCTSSVATIYNVENCLSNCLSAKPNDLLQAITVVENACAKTTGCNKIFVNYGYFATCYKGHNGLEADINNIINLFNVRNPSLTVVCSVFRQEKSCMSNITSTCSYLQSLQEQLMSQTSNIDIAYYICGSEFLDFQSTSSNCDISIEMDILNSCNVSCDVAKAKDSKSFCQLLQTQSDCLFSKTSTCTGLREKYLLPRLDTYAMANQFFNCGINVNGIIVQPNDATMCDYGKVLSDCFQYNPIPKFPFQIFQKLINLEFVVNDYCSSKVSLTNQITSCTKSYWNCQLAVKQVFKRPHNYSSAFNQQLGVFPLNLWGLTNLISHCPGHASMPICKVSHMQLDAKPTPFPSAMKFTFEMSATNPVKAVPLHGNFNMETPKPRYTPAYKKSAK